MACSGPCNGYYVCFCDLIKMKEELKQKKLEIEILEFKINKRETELKNNGDIK